MNSQDIEPLRETVRALKLNIESILKPIATMRAESASIASKQFDRTVVVDRRTLLNADAMPQTKAVTPLSAEARINVLRTALQEIIRAYETSDSSQTIRERAMTAVSQDSNSNTGIHPATPDNSPRIVAGEAVEPKYTAFSHDWRASEADGLLLECSKCGVAVSGRVFEGK